MSRSCSPIFIGGLSYSGKTQLRILVGAHPEVSMTRRTYMWERFYGTFGDLAEPANVRRCLDVMCTDANVFRLAPERRRIEQEFSAGPRTYAALFALFHAHHAERVGARRWGEQVGFIEMFADQIFASYPGARLVHMVRDPRARMGGGARRSSLGRVGWETARWLRSVELAKRNEGRFTDGYLVLRYEELAAHPRESMLRVCEFIGEVCTREMDDALATVTFDDGCAGTPEVARFVERHAADALADLGYDPGSRGASPGGALELAGWPVNRAGMTAWRVLKDRPLTRRTGS